MKARPRSVEREVAARMSAHFVDMGLPPVERQPILGRVGPDLTMNEALLAIDVKSRKCIPAFFAPEGDKIGQSLSGLLLLRLDQFRKLYTDEEPGNALAYPSIQVDRWFDHMKSWADQYGAIPALVLHRPGTKIDHAVFVISIKDRKRLKEVYNQWLEEHSMS